MVNPTKELVHVELPKVDSSQMQNWFAGVLKTLDAPANGKKNKYMVFARTGHVEESHPCETIKDAEILAYKLAETRQHVSIWQWVARHKKHVERVAFWVYAVDADGASVFGYPTLDMAELAHNQNKIGHNYNTVGYTKQLTTQTDCVAELEKRFGNVSVNH